MRNKQLAPRVSFLTSPKKGTDDSRLSVQKVKAQIASSGLIIVIIHRIKNQREVAQT